MDLQTDTQRFLNELKERMLPSDPGGVEEGLDALVCHPRYFALINEPETIAILVDVICSPSVSEKEADLIGETFLDNRLWALVLLTHSEQGLSELCIELDSDLSERKEAARIALESVIRNRSCHVDEDLASMIRSQFTQRGIKA